MRRNQSGKGLWLMLLGVSIALFLVSPCIAQTRPVVVPRVDPRIELTSIVSRLAGYNEYNNDDFKRYVADVDRHFARFKNHPAVEFAKQVRTKNGIGFDAVPSLAVHLNPPPELTPRVDLAGSALDTRWGKADAEKYAALLKQFYDDTDCAAFFARHAALYRTAEQRFQATLNHVQLSWYKPFYGEQPSGTFNLILGLLNGGGNFGPRVVHPDGSEDLYAIMGTWRIDKAGLPIYDDDDLPTIVHEYNHSFVNKLIEKHFARFERSGGALATEFADTMRQQGYSGGKTLVLESLVRACVVRYLKQNPSGDKTAQLQLAEEEARGFLWMGKLVALLDTYERDRKQYPTLERFIEPIARLFDTLPAQTTALKRSYALQQPKVVAVAPFPNNASRVAETVTEIRIAFDRPMRKRAGFTPIDALDPFIAPPTFTPDGKTLVGRIRIAPNREYGLGLTGSAFRSVDGYPLGKDFALYFTTRGFVPPPREPHFGYTIDGDTITFRFTKPAYLKESVESVAVAGEFNGWNPKTEGFQLTPTNDGTFQATLKADRIGKPGEKKLFTFVVNGTNWLEPARHALNVIKDTRGYGRLVITLSQTP